MTTEATPKENQYSEHSVNYFQSWHMGTTNQLLQTTLHKSTHSSRQPEAPSLPFITQWAKTAWDYINPAIITKSFKKCSISNDLDWHRRWCILGWTARQIWHWLLGRRRRDAWWNDGTWTDTWILAFWINIADNLLILVRLICRFDSRGITDPYTRVQLIREYTGYIKRI